jgi:hypothetical protein
MIWASGGTLTTKPKPVAKDSKHGYLSKTQEQQEAGQAPRRCRAGKEEAKHQGGAGQATWGGAEQVPGALDQA